VATLVRWDPFREVAALHNELSRFMNSVEGNGRDTQSWVPALDVWETEDALVYSFDLPGVAEDEISIEVEDSMLTVTAERQRTEQVSSDRYHRFERRFGTFSRTIGLPQGVNEDAIQADYSSGVLQVSVPKPEQVKPRRITVGAAGEQPGTIEGTAEQH
jgi:HSP20 family protein